MIEVARNLYTDMELRLPPATQTSVAIHLFGRSQVEWTTGSRSSLLYPSRGSVTIVPQGRDGLLRVKGGPSEVLKLGIPGGTFAEWAVREECGRRPSPLLDRLAVKDALVEQLSMALLQEVEQPRCIDTLYTDALTNALVAHLIRCHSEQPGERRPHRVHPLSKLRARKVIDYMEAQLSHAIGLADLARECGTSASHFSAQFRRTFGRSPAQYLLWLRLDRARTLLLQGRTPIADIAHQVGFASASHFSHAFRAKFGSSPRAVRSRGEVLDRPSGT